MELGSLQEHCIRRKEQHSRMLGIQNSRKGSSYPCPSSPSDGRFCCMHKRRMVLHRKVRGLRNCQLVLRNWRKELHKILQVHSSEVQNSHHYSRTCTSCPCPCSSSPWCGRFCRRHSRTEVLRIQGQ